MKTIELCKLTSPGESVVHDFLIEKTARHLLEAGNFGEWGQYFIVEINARESLVESVKRDWRVGDQTMNCRIYRVLFNKSDKSLFEIR